MSASTKADRKLMREINNMNVLQRIRANGPISRPELAEQTGLGLSTMSNIVTELLERKLVREVGEGDSSGGRRPNLLDINDSARHIFGVKIGPNHVWVALFDLRVRQMDTRVLESLPYTSYEELFACIAETIEDLRTKHRVSKANILGIGVSTSGLVDSTTGDCVYSPILHWENVPVGKMLGELSRMPVIVENDANAFAYGILRQEMNTEIANLICITTGPGVGGGIIVERRLYRGSHGGAGEIGHMTINHHGPKCSCGRSGCLEVLASDQFLLAKAQELVDTGQSATLVAMKDKLTPNALLMAAQLGDVKVREIFIELGENLGHGLVNLINIFNPDKIVIGGEGIVAAEFFMDKVHETVQEYAFPHLADRLEIVSDDGGEDVWLQGVAALLADAFFEVPYATA